MLASSSETMTGIMNEAGPGDYALLVVIGIVLFTVLLFIFSHISRYISFLKLKERTYVDDRTLDSVFTAVRVMSIIFVLISILYVGALLEIELFLTLFETTLDYIFILMAGVTFFSFLLLAQLSSVWISIKGEEAKGDPDNMVKSGILDFAQGFVKYILLFFGIVIAFLVGLLTTPNQEVRDQIFEVTGITGMDGTLILQEVLSLITIIVVLYLVGKLLSMMLDDFKSKPTKFPNKLIDLLKNLIRYLLYWLAFVLTLMIILDILGFMHMELVVFVIIGLTLSILLIIGTSPGMKNAISGVILLLTDSINKGDWVKLGDEDVGEVVEQHLIFTRVRTNFGDFMDIPNNKVMDSTIHNFTTVDGLRLDIDIPLSSEVDFQVIENTITASSAGVSGQDPKYPITVRLLSISKDTSIYRVNAWVLDPSQGDIVRSELIKALHDRLKKDGIALSSFN